MALLLSLVREAVADTLPQEPDKRAVHNTSSLLLRPARCVALHQGQVCYQHLQVSWRSDIQGNYCLYQDQQIEPLYCWQEQTQGTYEFDFASDAATQLQLKMGGQVVADATMEVAWVYKANTRRKTHWRLF